MKSVFQLAKCHIEIDWSQLACGDNCNFLNIFMSGGFGRYEIIVEKLKMFNEPGRSGSFFLLNPVMFIGRWQNLQMNSGLSVLS
jgi:hypothetical protein